MANIVEAWLRSGLYAEIAGHRLRPFENHLLRGTPLIVARAEARVFFLKDENNLVWVLKKYSPGKRPESAHLKAIQSLVPNHPGFQSGQGRWVLVKNDVSTSDFFDDSFSSWVEDSVLMSNVAGVDWALMTDRVRSGVSALPNDERLLLCRSLSEMIGVLEEHNLSHRRLSRTSVFIDLNNLQLQIINWDEIFHPTLAMPPNKSSGTCGYIAPFVVRSGRPDPLTTWRPQADRFSLAILNSEFLSLAADSPMAGDGGIFDQEELYDRTGDGINLILDTLHRDFPGADTLLKRALDARGFDDCPSPAEWIAFTSGRSPAHEATGAKPAFARTLSPIPFYSCFISYSNEDKEFAQRLHSRLRDAGLRVWFAPENVKSGEKLFEQVAQAIEGHDRLLVVLSESSLRSNWVQQEIRRARKIELESGRRKLFPIRLLDYETLQQWVCMDTASVEDVAEEVRSYFIPDFSNWKSYDDFEKGFARLLDDLKQSQRPPGS